MQSNELARKGWTQEEGSAQLARAMPIVAAELLGRWEHKYDHGGHLELSDGSRFYVRVSWPKRERFEISISPLVGVASDYFAKSENVTLEITVSALKSPAQIASDIKKRLGSVASICAIRCYERQAKKEKAGREQSARVDAVLAVCPALKRPREDENAVLTGHIGGDDGIRTEIYVSDYRNEVKLDRLTQEETAAILRFVQTLRK